jgi:hypothetical protein
LYLSTERSLQPLGRFDDRSESVAVLDAFYDRQFLNWALLALSHHGSGNLKSS